MLPSLLKHLHCGTSATKLVFGEGQLSAFRLQAFLVDEHAGHYFYAVSVLSTSPLRRGSSRIRICSRSGLGCIRSSFGSSRNILRSFLLLRCSCLGRGGLL